MACAQHRGLTPRNTCAKPPLGGIIAARSGHAGGIGSGDAFGKQPSASRLRREREGPLPQITALVDGAFLCRFRGVEGRSLR